MAHNDQPLKTMLRTGYYHQFMGHFFIRNKPVSDYGKPPWKRINQSTMMKHHLSNFPCFTRNQSSLSTHIYILSMLQSHLLLMVHRPNERIFGSPEIPAIARHNVWINTYNIQKNSDHH